MPPRFYAKTCTGKRIAAEPTVEEGQVYRHGVILTYEVSRDTPLDRVCRVQDMADAVAAGGRLFEGGRQPKLQGDRAGDKQRKARS